MLKYIQEDRKYVKITGFRNVKIKNIEEFFDRIRKEKPPNIEIQVFDANPIATWQHLYFAVINALKAFKNNENIADNLGVEILLYASAQRQIQKAIKLVGIKNNSSEIAVLIIGEKSEDINSALSIISKDIKDQYNELVLQLSKEKMTTIKKTFEISDEELKTALRKGDSKQALIDLVIERMALLATKR